MEFEQLLINSLLQKIAEIYKMPSPIFISTNDRYRLADYIQKSNPADKSKRLSYPLLFIQMKEASINTESYPARNLNRHPKYGSMNSTKNVINAHKFIPIRFSFELIHITQTFIDMFKFVKISLQQSVRKELQFTLIYDDINITIKIQVNQTVGVPEKDANVDLVNVYETSANLQVDAYVTDALGDVKEQPLINDLRVILEVDENVVVDTIDIPLMT